MFNMTTLPLDWHASAACGSLDPELFFSENAEDVAEAKKVCSTCPVKIECGSWATATKQEYGVWGGEARFEKSATITHGTYTGYVRGCRLKDCAKDGGCAGAKVRYSQDKRARDKAKKAKETV